MSDVIFTREQYEALRSAVDNRNNEMIEQVLSIVERENGIQRYFLHIRWQEVGGSPTPTNQFVDWPPNQTYLLVLSRPPTPLDVQDVLRNHATNYTGVMVSPDPEGNLGWKTLESFSLE